MTLSTQQDEASPLVAATSPFEEQGGSGTLLIDDHDAVSSPSSTSWWRRALWLPTARPTIAASTTDPSWRQPPEQQPKQWFPSPYEQLETPRTKSTTTRAKLPHRRRRRSLRRRLFFFLTEPDTSIASAIFYVVLVLSIVANNLVMMMQTMDYWQYIPTDCRSCGGAVSYLFDDDDSIIESSQHACVCPPTPYPWTTVFLNGTIYFFTVEWTLRVLCYEPPIAARQSSSRCAVYHYWSFLTSTSTVLDALAIFPYYMESFESNGLMSLRLLRLFRVFQLVRLGLYDPVFRSFTSVLQQSLLYLQLLLWILLFGAAFFGSMLYWLEKGEWQYVEELDRYAHTRTDATGEQSISPFTSIPATFWWFFVTATTVGYGDLVPTTSFGKWIATLAMLMGVLVIAFPVSVFSELWSKELRKAQVFSNLDDESDGDQDGYVGDSDRMFLAPNAENDDIKSYYGTAGGDGIVLDADEVAEIDRKLQSIEASQQRIRAILANARSSNRSSRS